MQINHIIAVSRSFFEQRQDQVKKIMLGFDTARRQLSADKQRMLPAGLDEMQTSVETLLRSVYRQGLISHPMSFHDIFGEALAGISKV